MARFRTVMRVETLAWLRVNHVPHDDDIDFHIDHPGGLTESVTLRDLEIYC